jgi:hypothetical protein
MLSDLDLKKDVKHEENDAETWRKCRNGQEAGAV